MASIISAELKNSIRLSVQLKYGHRPVASASTRKTKFEYIYAFTSFSRNFLHLHILIIAKSSQSIRAQSAQLRSTAEALINNISSSVWNHWNDSNNALNQRSSEMCEAKNSMQLHLHKTQQEIFDIERNIDLIRRAIESKANPLKVAQTRLEARSHRAGVEQCK